MEIKFENAPGTLIVRVAGDLRLWGHAPEEARLTGLIRAQENLPPRVVVNMSGITRLDTAGIASLIRIPIEAARRNAEVRVILPPGVPGQALHQLHVFEAWPNFADEAAAVRGTAASSAA